MEIHESVQKITESKDELGMRFCTHLLMHYPEVQHYFAKVGLRRQSMLLVNALLVIERHWTHPTPATEQYLRWLGTRHNDAHVPKDVHAVWSTAMLETMRRFHGQHWTPSLEKQWRQAFERAIGTMFLGYDERMII